MSVSWDLIAKALSGEDIAFLKQMALNAYGSGKGEGQNGGAGYIGLFNGHMMKFDTHAKNRILPECFMSGESKTASRQACAKLQEIINKVANFAKVKLEWSAAESCEKLLKDLGGAKSTSLLTRKIAATTLKSFGGEDLWDKAKAGRDMASLSTKNIETEFGKVKETFSEKCRECREKCQGKVDAAIQKLKGMKSLSNLEAVVSRNEGEGAAYVDRMKHEIEQVVTGLRTLPDEIARTWMGEQGPRGTNPLGIFLSEISRRDRDWLDVLDKEWYKPKVEDLRSEIDNLQKQRDGILQQIADLKNQISATDKKQISTEEKKALNAELIKLRKELLTATKEILSKNPAERAPKEVAKISEYSERIFELRGRLIDTKVQQELGRLQQDLSQLQQKHDQLGSQIAGKTAKLHENEVRLEFAKCINELFSVMSQVRNDFKGIEELVTAFSVGKRSDKRNMDEISKDAMEKLETFRLFRRAVKKGDLSDDDTFETKSSLSEKGWDAFRGPKLLRALSTIISENADKSGEVLPEDGDGTEKNSRIKILKTSDVKTYLDESQWDYDNARKDYSEALKDYDEIRKKKPKNDEETMQKEKAMVGAQARVDEAKKQMEEAKTRMDNAKPQMDKQLENDIRQGIKRYETLVRGLPKTTRKVKSTVVNEETKKIEEKKVTVMGVKERLNSYEIPQNYKEAFAELFPEGKMTVLEREAINEILSGYGVKI